MINNEVKMSREFVVRAGQHKFESGAKIQTVFPALPVMIDQSYSAAVTFLDDAKQPMANYNYRLIAENGLEVSGITDEFGKTQPIQTDQREKVDLYIADLPNNHQQNSGESPLLKKTYEALFYVEDPEDELDDIDHLEE
jgi:uncharacterized protein (DUF2345 family)